jgi:two-component system cell cycle response regulator DivK
MACILIVEDNPTNMKLAAYLLEHAGHAVLKAEDAVAGLRLAHEQHPDLMLMDIQLPGMDGVSALKELRAESDTAQLKVAALTAYAMKGDRERLLAAGFDGYFAKPIHHKEFLAGVGAMLDGASGGQFGAVSGEDDDHG